MYNWSCIKIRTALTGQLSILGDTGRHGRINPNRNDPHLVANQRSSQTLNTAAMFKGQVPSPLLPADGYRHTHPNTGERRCPSNVLYSMYATASTQALLPYYYPNVQTRGVTPSHLQRLSHTVRRGTFAQEMRGLRNPCGAPDPRHSLTTAESKPAQYQDTKPPSAGLQLPCGKDTQPVRNCLLHSSS